MNSVLILWGLTIGALALTWWRARGYVTALVAARPSGRTDQPGQRILGVLEAVGLHKKLLQRPLSGTLHALIFVSLIVLLSAIVQAFGSGLFPGFSLAPIGGTTFIALAQDIFGVLMLVGVGLAMWQRYVIRPRRFATSNGMDATLIYFLIIAIVVSMLLEAAFDILTGAPNQWRPVASAIAGMLSYQVPSAETLKSVFYWLHIGAILTFLVYIPKSKHRHMFLAAPNIFMRDLGSRGQSPTPSDDAVVPGVATLADFDFKQTFDLLSCTECGRCEAVCPANAAGLPLSPKLLITDLRDALSTQSHKSPIVGNVISADTLWACTTCRACMEVCPVEIEHLPKIIDLRRQLVEDGTLNDGMQEAFGNLTRLGNSLGKPSRMRPRWTKELPFRIKDARIEAVDVLWFVGDYASYDPRAQIVTRHVATLLHEAGVDFGILFDGERNSGNDVRRAGEEGLFEALATENIDALQGATFNRIMTTDPHSLNALKNEYCAFGQGFDVVHHSILLDELVSAGRLAPVSGDGSRVTYHDPCYLGRYNNGYEAPRRIIELSDHHLVDMPRCRENSFCCGAGGGRIWQDDEGVTERPSENRIKEAMSLGEINLFVVACPKDKVMYMAAIDALGVSEQMRVVDIAELLTLPNSETDFDAGPAFESTVEHAETSTGSA